MNYLIGLCFLAAFVSNENQIQAASCSCNCNDGSSGCPGNKYGPPVGTVPKRLVKQCVFPDMNEDKDSGTLSAKCKFIKQESDSSLRVTFNGNMRVTGCSTGCCRRWFLTINGQECKDPATIDTQIYANGAVNRHMPGTLDGFCYNIPKGEVIVGLSIASCPGATPGDGYTGWESVSRIVIEEMVTL